MTGALPALQERLPCAINDAQALRSLGIRVTVLTPGPEDLAAMGVNLMDPRRRTAVLETSLRTSAAALTGRGDGQPQVAGSAGPGPGGAPPPRVPRPASGSAPPPPRAPQAGSYGRSGAAPSAPRSGAATRRSGSREPVA